MKTSSVKLLAWTTYPLETIFALWQASRHNEPIQDPEEMAMELRAPGGAGRQKQVEDLFQKVLESEIPVAENVSFTFLLEDIPIELREQLVRHRIGVKVGDRVGMDYAPDLADSTWWSQSMRILDMSKFAKEERYRMPESAVGRKVEGVCGSQPAEELWQDFMRASQETYRRLVDAGMPLEDARGVIPLAATHRISWTLNLAALKHIVGKRSCWILQLGIWKPIIVGMIRELVAKVHPLFQRMIDPPCFEGGQFVGCKFKLDNERRVSGEDEIPPCSLYLGKHEAEAMIVSAKHDKNRNRWQYAPQLADWVAPTKAKEERFNKMHDEYAILWQRNADTGESL